jgi:hypothetical protein
MGDSCGPRRCEQLRGQLRRQRLSYFQQDTTRDVPQLFCIGRIGCAGHLKKQLGVAKGSHGGDGFCMRLLTSNFSKKQKQRFLFLFFWFSAFVFCFGVW